MLSDRWPERSTPELGVREILSLNGTSVICVSCVCKGGFGSFHRKKKMKTNLKKSSRLTPSCSAVFFLWVTKCSRGSPVFVRNEIFIISLKEVIKCEKKTPLRSPFYINHKLKPRGHFCSALTEALTHINEWKGLESQSGTTMNIKASPEFHP